jgi:hypothetical protein
MVFLGFSRWPTFGGRIFHSFLSLELPQQRHAPALLVGEASADRLAARLAYGGVLEDVAVGNLFRLERR